MTNPAEKKAVRSVPSTLGAKLVRELRQRLGGAHLARMLNVSETLLRQVGACERNPGPTLRVALAVPGLDVPLDAWTPSPSATLPGSATTGNAPSPVAAPPAPASPGAAEAVEVGTTIEELIAQIERLKRQAIAADLDPLSSIRDKAAVASALNHALRARSRALGEEDVTRGKVLASREWSELRDTICQALDREEFGAARLAVLTAVREYQAGES